MKIDESLLPAGGVTALNLVEAVTWFGVDFEYERRPDGGMDLHFTHTLAPGTAERLTIPFTAEGFDRFYSATMGASSGIAIASGPRQ